MYWVGVVRSESCIMKQQVLDECQALVVVVILWDILYDGIIDLEFSFIVETHN